MELNAKRNGELRISGSHGLLKLQIDAENRRE